MADSRLSDPLVEMSSKYFTKLSASMLDKDMNQASPVNFTVTAMHGVSHEYMVEAFRTCGFKVCVCVCKQDYYDRQQMIASFYTTHKVKQFSIQ